MSYNHNTEADFAASELARMFVTEPSLCYPSNQLPRGLSATASYEPPSSGWPKADGLVSLLEDGGMQRDIAIEYKRQQEGIHGLLTAIGQAQAYIHKGYSGAALVLPSMYPTLQDPTLYVKDVLDMAVSTKSIGIFRYADLDLSSPSPFANKLSCMRPLEVLTQTVRIGSPAGRQKTQWVHMREGSTTRDAFLRFLQTAKRLSTTNEEVPPLIPQGLRDAVSQIAPDKTAENYLSNTVDDTRFLNRVWRAFWFERIATHEVLTIWKKEGTTYVVPNAFTRILRDDNAGYSQIFEGRANGLKNQIVNQLNLGAINESEAWEQLANGITRPGSQKTQGVRERAHSYREDLDSSLAQLRWIDAEGRPTDHGYHYMTLCERYGGANSHAAREYFGATLLQTGHYASFLHYIHRLSEEIFSADPLAFTKNVGGRPVFNEASYSEYLSKLEDELTYNLKVMGRASGRARPRQRTPFQAELTLLRNYGFVSTRRYRLGIGIPIDWEMVHKAINIKL